MQNSLYQIRSGTQKNKKTDELFAVFLLKKKGLAIRSTNQTIYRRSFFPFTLAVQYQRHIKQVVDEA